jgi:hypothetical protein
MDSNILALLFSYTKLLNSGAIVKCKRMNQESRGGIENRVRAILIHPFSQANRKVYKPQDVGLSVWMLKV